MGAHATGNPAGRTSKLQAVLLINTVVEQGAITAGPPRRLKMQFPAYFSCTILLIVLRALSGCG